MIDYEKVLDEEPLIPSEDSSRSRFPIYRSSPVRNRVTAAAIATPWILLLLLGSWVAVQYSRRGPSNPLFPQMTYSPAQDALEYEARKFRLGFGDDLTEFQGPPSPELDKTWNSMYYMGFYSMLSQSEAAQLPNKTIIMPHDPERRYVVGLDVFHQLHCLNTLRKALSPEYYGPGGPGADQAPEAFFEFEHLDHCVDSIRQSLVCNADIAPLPWQWVFDAKTGKGTNFARAGIMHTCRRWDKIQEWALGRLSALDVDNYFREPNDPLDPDTWVDGTP